MSFKKRLKKTTLYFIAGFTLVLLCRLGFGFFNGSTGNGYDLSYNQSTSSSGEGGSLSGVINIASDRHEYKKAPTSGAPETAEIVSVDQKYEKTGTLFCKSDTFEEDEKTIQDAIESHKGIVQFEQKSGNEGNRRLNLQIGIPPAGFDDFISLIKESQQVTSISITKKDKTNEYRELNTRLAALTNTRNSLADLKNKGGKIEEYIDLENRILEIDEQLRNLGVSLGNFDSENEFCTVKLTLKEDKRKVAKTSFLDHFFNALEWTIQYYLLFVALLFFALGCSYLLLVIVDKLKIIDRIKKHLND